MADSGAPPAEPRGARTRACRLHTPVKTFTSLESLPHGGGAWRYALMGAASAPDMYGITVHTNHEGAACALPGSVAKNAALICSRSKPPIPRSRPEGFPGS